MKNRKECRKSESWEEWRVTIKIGRNEEWKMKNVKYEVRRMRIKANWRVGNSCLDEKKKKKKRTELKRKAEKTTTKKIKKNKKLWNRGTWRKMRIRIWRDKYDLIEQNKIQRWSNKEWNIKVNKYTLQNSKNGWNAKRRKNGWSQHPTLVLFNWVLLFSFGVLFLASHLWAQTRDRNISWCIGFYAHVTSPDPVLDLTQGLGMHLNNFNS